MFCPNKNTEAYKQLEKSLGEIDAYNAWFKFNKDSKEPVIPTVEQAKELLSDIQKPKVQFSIDEEYKSLYEKYGDVIGKDLPYKKAIDTAFTINKVFKSIIARVYGDEDTGYRITIERKELVNVQQKVLDKMKSLFPKIRRKVISMQEAVNMVGENAYKANAFILDNIVYFIDGKITDETVIEEFLHPFIEYLYQYNKSLFDNLYEEASQDKELKRSVIDRYSKVTKNVNDIKKELVTQKLTQLLNYELKNVPERKIEETKSLIKKVFDQLSNFFYKILGGKQKLDAIILPPKLSLGTLAQIINTENLELPVSFTYQPMFSLLDDVQTQSRAQGLYIDGDNYKDKNGTIYERLTEWVRNVLSTKEKSLSIEEWAALEAKRRFQNGNTNLNASGVEVLKQPDGSEITLEDLTREILIDFNTSRAFGTIAHLIIDKSIKEKMGEDVTELSLKIQAEAEGKPDQNAIDLKRLNWIKDNIESILLLTGTNALDSRVDKDKRDKILSEIKYSFEPLGIATTIDGLIQHSDGRLSIKDWKTGNLLNDSLRPYLMNEFSRQIENIIDSKLDRAKAEVVLRAMMIKYNNPAAKFRQLSIEQLNRSNLVETHNINLEAFLPMLEEFFKDKNPEAYQKMKAKNLFDPLEYSLMPVVDEKSAVDVQERIENLDKEILLTKNRMIQEKSSYKKNKYKQKLEDLTRERLELAGMASIDLTEQKSELGFWKRHFGKLGNMSNPIYRTYKMLIDKAKMLMITEEKALFNEFDKLQEKLMKEYDSRPGNIGLKYKTADGSGLYDFMWVKKNKSGAIGYYRITEKDAEWDTLTETQKAYVKFFSESLSKLYNEVAKQKVFITATGQELNNAEFSKVDFGTELPEDFMPRVYMDFGEYMSHFGVGKTAALEYHKFKNKYLRTDFYANNANEVLPFKFLGNAAIIGTGNYTFNAERAYKEFAKNLLRKKHLDKIQAIGNGISVIFGNNDWEFDKQFINDRIMVEVTGMKRKTDFSQSKYSSLRKIEKYGFDFDAILGGLKEIVTAGTMWLKPFAGLRNGVYTLMTNHKNAVSRSIAKRVGVPPEELDFTESDLIKADKLWMQYYYDIIAGKEEENKLHLLLKQYNYLPDAYDFRVIKSKLISEKNKFMNSDYLYFFHSIFEDWGTGSIFTALMLHNKHNGKSLYDSYTVKDGQLVWEGGVRGKRADGSEITSLTYEELNKFKSISAMIHGNYRDDEKGAIELYAWGRLIMQFKRFVPQQLINLLQGRQMSYSFGQWKEMLDQNNNKLMVWEPQIIRGRMALMFDFLIKGTAFTAQGQKYWDSLSNREKQDLVAGLFTLLISYMGGLLATIAFDDDEEEKWIAQSWIKVFRDLSEGMRPIDLIENFRYSSVSVHKLYNLTKAVTEFSYGIATGEVNKYGEYKGSNEIAKTLPFFSTVYDIDRALNNTRTGKNVGLNIFNADNYNWDIDQIK